MKIRRRNGAERRHDIEIVGQHGTYQLRTTDDSVTIPDGDAQAVAEAMRLFGEGAPLESEVEINIPPA